MRRLIMLSAVAGILALGAGQANADNVAIFGNNQEVNIQTFLNNNGHTATLAPGSLVGFDTVILLRTPGDAAIQNFVLNGGHLITEWDASDWALNTANLLDATDTGGGFVGTGTNVTFTAAGIAAGLNTGLTNPYSDGPRTEFFRNFSSVGASVQILATRPGDDAILHGNAGSGMVTVVGYDWADSFPSGASNNGTLLLNILAIRGGGGGVGAPEPASVALAGLGLLAIGGIVRRRK